VISAPTGRRLGSPGAALCAALCAAVCALPGAPALRAQEPVRPVVVASKPFGESYLLAEMFAQLLEARGIPAERRLGLGATEIAFAALRSGSIDVYPEYTGTLSQMILGAPAARSVAELRSELRGAGLTVGNPLGFSNTYALAVRRETAERLSLRTISDLARHPEFEGAFSPGFTARDDGFTAHKWADLGFDSHSLFGIAAGDFEVVAAEAPIALTYDCVREP